MTADHQADARALGLAAFASQSVDAFATPQNTKQVRAERVIGLIHDECIWFALKIDLCKGQAA